MKSKTPWSGIVDAAFFHLLFVLLINRATITADRLTRRINGYNKRQKALPSICWIGNAFFIIDFSQFRTLRERN